MTIPERVRKTIAAVLRVPEVNLSASTVLAEVAALDSLKLVEVVAALDEEFDTRLPSDELAAVQTVDDMIRLVERST